MSTPHNNAKKGDIAKTVLMPGDPLRAKFIAENYLENAVCYNEVRGMLGFTGTYKGVPVSVQGSGMGMPSIGIYSWELFNEYDVENIIRVGTAGAVTDNVELRDVIISMSASTNSNYASCKTPSTGYSPPPTSKSTPPPTPSIGSLLPTNTTPPTPAKQACTSSNIASNSPPVAKHATCASSYPIARNSPPGILHLANQPTSSATRLSSSDAPPPPKDRLRPLSCPCFLLIPSLPSLTRAGQNIAKTRAR